MKLNTFIRSVHLDEQKRIIITVEDKFQHYLQNEKARNMIKNVIIEKIGPDYVKLEIGQKGVRITVRRGTEEKNLEKVNKELTKGLGLAMKFFLGS